MSVSLQVRTNRLTREGWAYFFLFNGRTTTAVGLFVIIQVIIINAGQQPVFINRVQHSPLSLLIPFHLIGI